MIIVTSSTITICVQKYVWDEGAILCVCTDCRPCPSSPWQELPSTQTRVRAHTPVVFVMFLLSLQRFAVKLKP